MLKKLIKKLDDWLVEDWRKALHFWSVRGQLFWAAVAGLYSAWPAFQDHIPIKTFTIGSVVMSVALLLSRLKKQGWLHTEPAPAIKLHKAATKKKRRR